MLSPQFKIGKTLELHMVQKVKARNKSLMVER
jgi:hypothetical protein